MGGFMGWFLTFVIVVAIFNAEKLPALCDMLEEKFKNSVDAAKEGSKLAKDKIKQVKTELENKKSASAEQGETEENTPEEIAAELQVMSKYVPTEKKSETVTAPDTTAKSDSAAKTDLMADNSADEPEDEKPIDLENRH